MTSLRPAVPPAAVPPRIRHVPAYTTSTGDEAVELAAMAGLVLDEWQAQTLRDSLGEQQDGRWAAFEVGVVAARQNGKNAILEARQLTGLFLLGEQLIIHSAHLADTSMEAFRRLEFLIENTPDFDRRVKAVRRTNGHEAIELKNGQRIRFRTRTKGGGRGFSGDCVIFDEVMVMPEATLGAILPVVSARPNPQVWYTGSAVDQMIHEHGVVLARLRTRGMSTDPGRLAYFEWSAPGEKPDELSDREMRDPGNWRAANPALGIRITAEHIELERRAMDGRTFAVERLGVGDWPALDGTAGSVIDPDRWQALADPRSTVPDPICFAIDVSPDRVWGTISFAGTRTDGLAHVEVADRRKGTGWIVRRASELAAQCSHVGVVVDGKSPAVTLVHELAAAGLPVTLASTADHAAACGRFFDRVDQGTIRHLGTDELVSAVRGSTKRPLGDAWLWSRKSTGVDLTPLVSATLALWGSETIPPAVERPEPVFAWG